jgi:hypothetical protein
MLFEEVVMYPPSVVRNLIALDDDVQRRRCAGGSRAPRHLRWLRLPKRAPDVETGTVGGNVFAI